MRATIDRLGHEGAYFPNTITPIPRTTPAIGTLLTGVSPQTHLSRDVGDPIGNVTTLAEVLAAKGFATLAVSSNRSAGPEQGFDRGFERFVSGEDLLRIYGDTLYRDLTEVPPTATG